MTEDDARDWIAARWGNDAVDRLERLGAIVRDEAERQNLIAPSTLPHLWSRHLLDSAQLLPLAPVDSRPWLDIGTGAGFPGLVIAVLRRAPMTFVEPRARRAAFLAETAAALELDHVEVRASKVEDLGAMTFGVISARAVAPTGDLLRWVKPLRGRDTTLIFPRGRSGRAELENLSREWQKMFHVEQSLTDAESVILVANGAA